MKKFPEIVVCLEKKRVEKKEELELLRV